MNQNHHPPRPHILALAGLSAVLLSGPLAAAPFLYTPGDLVVTYRQNGSASDLAINLGRVSTFANLAPGTEQVLDQVVLEQLRAAFSSFDALRWSVAAANRPPFDPAYPPQTLWVSAPRLEPNTPAVPWLRKGQFVQGNTGSQIDAVGANAAITSSTLPGGPNNTATLVEVPVNAAFAISPVLGDPANYVGTFQGTVEQTTPDDFESGTGAPSRSDLFELLPGTTAAGTLNAPGRWLGTFEFRADGSLRFRTAAPVIEAPVISNIRLEGDAVLLTFSTTTGLTYLVRHTDAAGLATPAASWTSGPSITGDGAEQTVSVPTSPGDRFYILQTQP